jgi:SAM-dependent methyltransferase
VTTALEQGSTDTRARMSLGTSGSAVYRMVVRAVRERHSAGGVLADVGCGTGALAECCRGLYERYVGIDLVRYDDFPAETEFVQADLDTGRAPLPDGMADVVVSAETIEHVENPRALFRELVRLARPGGWVVVTTPNQLSLLSKFSLLLRNQFPAFREAPGLYPAHLTALLEIDLLRMARECGLTEAATRFTNSGRIPGTPLHWPAGLGFRGRLFSDNVLLAARKPSTV